MAFRARKVFGTFEKRSPGPSLRAYRLSTPPMRTYVSSEDEVSKRLFPRVSARGLHLENMTYKLKRSISVH